jgi:hypothetical protein
MTSILSFNTSSELEKNSDLLLCSAVKTLDDNYMRYQNKMSRSFFQPNELMGNYRASLSLLHYDNVVEMRRGLCDKGVVDQRLGNNKIASSKEDNGRFLIPICNQKHNSSPPFQNYIDCDQTKCCSIRHDIFGNLTKRI